jgi:NAD(P)-dependent dehydrogenase (short-subunit alcohol dehydrogenase family)
MIVARNSGDRLTGPPNGSPSAAAERFGRIYVVVANAGIEQWAPVRTVEPDDFRRVIDTNVVGVFNAVRAALPSVLQSRGYMLVLPP